MQPMATAGAMAAALEGPVSELDDFDAVVRLYWPRVFRYALASLRDPDAAGSVAQDCFLRAYAGRGRFRGDCPVARWLMQIAVNLVRDRARSRRLQFWRRAEASGPDLDIIGSRVADGALSPEARAVLEQQVASVWSATRSLPEKQRAVFLLRFVDEMDVLEIAAVTGMREGTVKAHLFRAVRTIRRRVGESV